MQPDAALGLRRARAAALLMLALPGSAYVYQGDELGLPEHTTLDDADRQDPAFARTAGEDLGRDGCRVPLPWEADAPGLGFSTGRPWLPQPPAYAALARDRERADPTSPLALWTEALRLRRDLGLGDGELRWTSAPGADVLAFDRGDVHVTANIGPDRVDLPARRRGAAQQRPRRRPYGPARHHRLVALTPTRARPAPLPLAGVSRKRERPLLTTADLPW